MGDLNLVLEYLVAKYPGMRVDLCSFQNTGGWRVDVRNTFGRGPTPMAAAMDLLDLLGHSYADVVAWEADNA